MSTPEPNAGGRSYKLDVHITPNDLRAALVNDAREGLTSVPKELPSKWFYDERGSELFTQITRLPEYYLTDAERSILEVVASEVVEKSGSDSLIELGSGTSEKTRLLLDAFSGAKRLRRFVAFDVSRDVLGTAAASLAQSFPETEVTAVVGDFEQHLSRLPGGPGRTIAFLGSTIGNFKPHTRSAFLKEVSELLDPGESLLVGVDLVKDVARLERAYNDEGGVTAAFNRNILTVMNHVLGANFNLDDFDHVARFDHVNEWIEMVLIARRTVHVRIPELDADVTFAQGEEMRTEISAKFTRERLESELRAAELDLQEWWTDARGDFALTLSFRR